MSRRVVFDPMFVENIVAGLARALGEGFQVVVNPGYERWLDMRQKSDLAVIDNETGHATLIEVKLGILEDDDVSIAAIAELANIRETNQHLHPKVVLVTTMRVSEMVGNWLTRYGIEVIRGTSAGEVVPALVDLITAGTLAHR